MEDSSTQPGKTFVITGATSGIGFAVAQQLAAEGDIVIGVGRSKERCRKASAEIRRQVPEARITYLLADLSSLDQIRSLAGDIRVWLRKKNLNGLDILINNAAMVTNWFTANENDYEMQFTVNHLAAFLLTHELIALLREAPAGRILTTSSGSHRNTRIHWPDPMLRRRYNTLSAYKQSKLANVLFMAEFNRRFAQNSAMQAFAIDPGLVNTQIGFKGTSGIVRLIWEWRRRGGKDPSVPARTFVHVAKEPSVDSAQGVYWKDCRPVEPGRYAQREDEAARLWKLSERLCGISSWE